MKKEGPAPVEIAQKQRHLYLLMQVKNNRPLKRAELAELDRYEKMAGKLGKNLKLQSSNRKSRPRGPGGKFVKQKTDPQLAALAKELQKVAALDNQFDEHFKLEEHPRVKDALKEAVAVRVEELIKQRFAELGGKQKDFRKVTLQQLIEITGKKRRTIYFWTDRGMPREPDGSFKLPEVFAWFEKYTETKTLDRLPEEKQQTEYQIERAKQLRRINAEEEHRLLDRSEVLAGLMARHQRLVSSLAHKAEELAMETHGQPKGKITEIINEAFDKILAEQCSVPEELHLPPAAAEQFKKLLDLLNGQRPEGE